VAAVLHVKGILPTFEHSLILTEVGVLLEVLCFTAGLSYKSLLTEKDRHAAEEVLFRQIHENQKLNARLESIKAKITKELQDEMGATLTGISIYSDIGEKYNQQQNKQGVSAIFEQIGQSARKMVNEVHDTIWMIQPQHNESAKMWQKAYQAAADAVLNKNIKLHFTIAEYAENVPLDLELRKNMYLLIKECVANAVKHAGCKNIWINYRVNQPTLILTIRDDGKGFDPDSMHSGTGLINIKKRVRHCRGDVGIQSDATGSEFYFEFNTEELPSSFI
jgi:signal transduction histidine kinase